MKLILEKDEIKRVLIRYVQDELLNGDIEVCVLSSDTIPEKLEFKELEDDPII